MKAVSLRAIGQLELVDVPIPHIENDQLLVRMGAATICRSDLNDIQANPFGIPLPVTIGHEAAGTVVEMGKLVTGFRIGDRIAAHPVHPCGNCQACRDGMPHLCLNMGHFGINMPGAMAEYFVVRQDRARQIPNDMDFALASLAEPVCVCLEALAQAKLLPGNSLLILGDGPFGVLMAHLAQTFGLSKIVIAGWQDYRLAFAKSVIKVNSQHLADPIQELMHIADGAGYDAAILAVGSAQAFSQALHCLKPRGRLVVFSALPGETPVDLLAVHLKELEIVGACNDQDRFDDAVRLLSDSSLGISKLITHKFPLSEFRQAFDLAEHEPSMAMKVSFTT